MEADRIEIARALGKATNERDLAAIERLTDPDVEFHSRLAASEGRVYNGHEGFRRYFADIDEAYQRFRFDFREFTPVGDSVVAEFGADVLGKGSGVELDQTFWTLVSFSGDRVSSIHTFADRDEAIAHAGSTAEGRD